MNLYLFRKYWSKHKGRLFSLILSIILLTATAVFSILNERSDLRRILHEQYDMSGNYGAVLHNVSDEGREKISSIQGIERIGVISAIGTINVAEREYTVGSFEDDTAKDNYHLALIKGRLPNNSGEIAVPQHIINQMYADIDLGDEVNIELIDLNNEKQTMSFRLCGIISDQTTRYDMEYMGLSYGTQIIYNEIEYPTPSIYIDNKDTENLTKYYNYLISDNDETLFSEGGKKFTNAFNESIQYANNFSSGSQSSIIMSMTNNSGTIENGLTATESDNTKVIRYITFFMMFVAAIAMFSGVISVMPQRIESLQLLRSIGMSKRKLFGMFITEFFLFWLIGNIIGIALGCGVHEIVILFRKLIGISAYRGYVVEFIITKITVSPFFIPLLLSFIIAILSLIVPIYRIWKMSFYQKATTKRSRKSANSLNKAFSKITGTRFLTVLSCFSVVIVVFISSFGYCYYTNIGKGKTLLTSSDSSASDNYYKVNGINMKENDFDCAITLNIPYGNAIAVYDKEYGISDNQISQLSENANVFAWSIYPAFTVIYKENEEPPAQLKQNVVPFNEGWENYNEFKTNTIFDISLILINDNLMKELGDYSLDDVLILSKIPNFPYNVGDTIPMFTCLCDDGTSALLNTSKWINVNVTQQYDISTIQASDDDILKNASAFKYAGNYAIAMTAKKAEELGFYHAEYSTAFVDFDDNLEEREIRNTVSKIMDRPVQITTIYELKHNAIMNTLSSNINVFVLFILLLVLCIINTINLIRMNIQNNIETFSILHSIGLPINKTRNMFVKKIMNNTLISVIIGMTTTLVGKLFLQARYNEYYSLLEKQQTLSGNHSFPNMIFFMTTSEIDKSNTELYSITEKIDHISKTYFIGKEMWSPSLVIPFIVICGIILLSTFMCVKKSAKNIKDERSARDD